MAPKILVVDSNEAFATMLKEILEAEGGYSVDVAHSDHRALGLLPRTDYALTIVDMGLDPGGDAYLDLAVTNRGSNTVGVLLGSATGFAAANTHSTGGTAPYGIVAGDFNADGKLDLVVTNRSSGNVAVLLGNGTGGLNVTPAMAAGGLVIGGPAGTVSTGTITTADTDRVTVTLGNGTIVLSGPQDINTTSSPQFAGLTVTGVGTGMVKATAGVLSAVTGRNDL